MSDFMFLTLITLLLVGVGLLIKWVTEDLGDNDHV